MLIAESTRRLLGNRFDLKDLGPRGATRAARLASDRTELRQRRGQPKMRERIISIGLNATAWM